MRQLAPLAPRLLPAGVRSRFIEGVNGLCVHVLEAGDQRKPRGLLLLLHGFPELAYSWRKLLNPLADAGFHVVAPDQRGYGRTTGSSTSYDQELRPFSMLHLAHDALALVFALGYRSVASVIGHDFGSPVAAWCALVRPDVFRSAVLMSAPFAGPPALPSNGGGRGSTGQADPGLALARLDAALAQLPRPRQHYQCYYARRAANPDMMNCPQGLHAFLRAYFHHKSADWDENSPFRLKDWSATEMARMPTYYIMDRGTTMPETVAPFMPSAAKIAACAWLTEAELGVYSAEFHRTGFQGGLNWYRARFDATLNLEQTLFADRSIDVPTLFIAGKSDWGAFQAPGALERMQSRARTRLAACHLVEGAGHWVTQERPHAVAALLAAFCSSNA
jgi:pimeloyl-ACP methyl ester carboxylesterase